MNIISDVIDLLAPPISLIKWRLRAWCIGCKFGSLCFSLGFSFVFLTVCLTLSLQSGELNRVAVMGMGLNDFPDGSLKTTTGTIEIDATVVMY